MASRRVLEDSVERSAAPAAVGAVLGRLVDHDPSTLERLVEGAELSALGRAVVAVAEASNVLARLFFTDEKSLQVLADLGSPPVVDASDAAALRRSARLGELYIAGRDLLGLDGVEQVGAALAGLAAEVLHASVSLSEGDGDSRDDEGRDGEGGDGEGLAVVGMGKLGGEELNYASDVDVLFVAGEADVTPVARRVMELARSCFRVDADLRPEGRAGPLVRSVDSYSQYWRRWASAWEFQALLKARPVAGDRQVGAVFAERAAEALWGRSFSADELSELRTMKARTEEIVHRRGMAGRELKRGPGGIRDVEFAVQLLQLVHGRSDAAIRRRSTLGALAELAGAGYVSPEDAQVLTDHYRFLRTVEHRLQLLEHEQTHAVPSGAEARHRLARVLGFADDRRGSATERFDDELRRRLAEVRAIHERLFFRPLLETFSGAGPAMDAESVDRRLAAFGFADARRTAAAVEELSSGLTRTSRLMAQLLPLLLDWLSLTPDPDLGLLGLRTLVTHPHQRSLVLNTFRESPEAARRLCLLLGSSRALSEAMARNPELISSLDDDAAMQPAAGHEVLTEAQLRLGRESDDESRRAQLVRLRQDQFVRIAAADLLGILDVSAVGAHLSATAETLLEAALADVRRRRAEPLGFCVIGLGRLGGGELSYASDLDVMFVHDGPVPAAGEALGEAMLSFVHGDSPATRMATLDLDLRPEGAKGRLSRDVAGYRTYFQRWAQTWERQAMIRARVVAGDRQLGERFLSEAGRFVWERPFGDDEVAEIRRMKARIERERIPAGEDPQFHLKLGPGALADVEWTVQLLQLGNRLPGTSTLQVLDALEAAGIVEPADAAALRTSYRFCEHARNRWHLVGALAGGVAAGDALPARGQDLSRLARSLDTSPTQLRDEYRRVTRRARRVVERLFYGIDR
ncbi:MAG TPA: bifunctional [glutamine synthetase] adenylyltransferase/[glutamine synthetase]-adenylyl-L-tyrosine phosphorylase [Acidimicrobiales bacterium]|nr:bifunctional [glutamine synthetase] adenylyltransferase/[glutamine synthetase]-adenylyl-L-tyrosine phosphorylase [Acidimicrobiales bacterium]